MTFDNRDIMLLRLAGRYRWLPYDKLLNLGFVSLSRDIEALRRAGVISISRNKLYLKPTPQGYELLHEYGFDSDVSARRAYANSPVLRRRLETAEIMLTALRAGIDTLPDNVDALSKQPVFFPAFAFRTTGTNLMNNATCSGFGHWGNTAYMLHYVSIKSHGMFLTNELKIFHNLASIFSARLNEPEAMIFAGESYKQVYTQLTETPSTKKKGSKSFVDFSDVYKHADIPIHLISCDEMGARQLAFMRQPDYNTRIAKTAFGSRWTPCDDAFPGADGIIDGAHPLIIAADMDIRRVAKIIADAKKLGKEKVLLAAFRSQIEDLLIDLFPRGGIIQHLIIQQRVLDAAFGKDFSLYSMDKTNSVVKEETPYD